MTIDQMLAELNEAAQGMGGETPVEFRTLSEKSSGQEFGTVNRIIRYGGDTVVYPNPGSVQQPPRIVVEFA